MPTLIKAKLSEIPAAFPPAPLSDDEFDIYVQVDDKRDNCLSGSVN